ncbi:hypothetical protein D3C72_2057720 [compost metagenome]
MHRAAGARHQRRAQFLFERADLLRHRAMREAQAASGLGHGAVARHGDQRMEKVGVHNDRYSIVLSYPSSPYRTCVRATIRLRRQP